MTDNDYNAWVLLHQTCDALFQARERELQPLGISPVAAAALFLIQRIDEPVTPAELSRWLFRRAHSVFGLLKRMEKEGLVKRTKDLERKNIVRVALTEKGQQILDLSMKRDSIHRVFSSLSGEQLQQLTSCLEVLRGRALGEIGIHGVLPFP